VGRKWHSPGMRGTLRIIPRKFAGRSVRIALFHRRQSAFENCVSERFSFLKILSGKTGCEALPGRMSGEDAMW